MKTITDAEKIKVEEIKEMSKKRNFQHKSLAAGRWRKLPFFEQMANIGSEVHRAIKWKGKSEKDSQLAFERALELFDLTIMDEKNKKRGRLKEILRLRELFVDYFFENNYQQKAKDWENYFLAFAFAANKPR